MRRFFRRHRKKAAVPDDAFIVDLTAGPSAGPSGQSQHVCTSMCDGLASLPPEFHESIIAQLTESLGGQTPDTIRIENLQLKNPRLVPEGTRDIGSELEERRDVEGNTDLAVLPLALPTTYQYPPLPSGHARFLRLGGLGPHPFAYLESHPLANPPPYIAISYCWDPKSARRGMFLDSRSFSISETVLEVLNQVQASQHATGSRELLWVDQICINQEDGAEKLDQIYRMGEIYSRASKVFIWLGPTADGSDVALGHMRRMLDEIEALNDATATRADVPDDLIPTLNDDHGKLYGHLFLRPWFRRLWTVQEAVLARRLVVMCGYLEVDFDLLAQLAFSILTYGSLDLFQVPGADTEKEMNEAIIGVANLHMIRPKNASVDEMLQGLDIVRFRALVTDSRSRQVTMAPDRVHALMGLAPRQVREYMAGIQRSHPDQTMWQLYTHFAMCLLEHDPEWRFLSFAPSKERPSELPSWVPNFNSEPPFASRFVDPSCKYTAGISPATAHLVSRTVTPTELIACGFRLDVIAELVPQTAFREDNQNTKPHDVYISAAARDWEAACVKLCQRVYNLGPEQFPRFYVETLLASSTATPADGALGGRANQAYHIFYMACRLRDQALAIIREGGQPVPERWRGTADGMERFADQAVITWRNKLPVQDYALLLEFTATMKAVCSGRPYVMTVTGLLGLGCPGVRVGDVVCVLYGTTVLYLLRPRADGTYEFVGDAFLHGMMHGEAITSPQRGPDEMIRIR
ncbi:heterokaryon incompatibility protein-domain-containing protein [Echria macrotheca]|uniref:Heterokaryon incompatibility protein-domain-containing protein n=1 Tax=Echria macrotheca TaxID=438768 RepID=A0AAJ0F4B9_9PEZI|nr:heterokaryon incompatibility protein-domain-containing protein [Echria macrotheca]